MFHTLIYISKAEVSFDRPELKELAQKAWAFNEQVGITGLLYYEKEHFLQYLEGSETDVLPLMSSIEQDSRHTVQRITEKANYTNRRFPSWHMHNLRQQALIKIQMEKVLLKNMMMQREDFILDSKRADNSLWGLLDEMCEYQAMLV